MDEKGSYAITDDVSAFFPNDYEICVTYRDGSVEYERCSFQDEYEFEAEIERLEKKYDTNAIYKH